MSNFDWLADEALEYWEKKKQSLDDGVVYSEDEI